tara:strand:+ start:541 stop:939 length:399 start_codon:yes stop_codon:yes gene_type:complete
MTYKFIDLMGQILIRKDSGFEIINGIGIYEIDEKTFARIKITSTEANSRDYNAVNVSIRNKDTGHIDGTMFIMSDYLKPDFKRAPEGKSKHDTPTFKINERFENIVWKGIPPTEQSLTELEKEILRYIEVFI